MANVIHVVVGTKTKSATEKDHLIYFGDDGVAAVDAAKRAMETGDYIDGRIKRQAIYMWIPCATVPVPAAKPAEPSKAARQPAVAAKH